VGFPRRPERERERERMRFIDTSKLSLPKAIEHSFKEFCRGLQETYGDELTTILVYGSVARQEYFPERSDINTLIVLKNADLETLRKTVDLVHKAREACKVTPFFLTAHDIDTSRDVFPIKFYDMRDAYHIVYGADILQEMDISDANLRLELEQEMKILLLELRQFFIQRAKKGGPGGAEHLLAYFNSFLYLMKRLLKLQGVDAPVLNDDLIRVIAQQYEMDLDMMKKFLEYKKGKPVKNAPEEAVNFSKAVSKAADIIDKLLVEGNVSA
jgi:predicted nucleotidyltransferase